MLATADGPRRAPPAHGAVAVQSPPSLTAAYRAASASGSSSSAARWRPGRYCARPAVVRARPARAPRRLAGGPPQPLDDRHRGALVGLGEQERERLGVVAGEQVDLAERPPQARDRLDGRAGRARRRRPRPSRRRSATASDEPLRRVAQQLRREAVGEALPGHQAGRGVDRLAPAALASRCRRARATGTARTARPRRARRARRPSTRVRGRTPMSTSTSNAIAAVNSAVATRAAARTAGGRGATPRSSGSRRRRGDRAASPA